MTTEFVYRIWDPKEREFVTSSQRHGRGRSMWASKSTISLMLNYMRPEVRERMEVKKFELVEVSNDS